MTERAGNLAETLAETLDGVVDGVVEGGVHVLPIRVYYDDTDAGGVVYYANYLRMAERARTEMLRAIGAGHTALAGNDGVMLTVRRCEIDYLRPARLNDALTVHSRITEIGGASLTAEQVVRRDNADLARLTLRIACVTTAGRAARMPAGLRDALRRFRHAADRNQPETGTEKRA